MWVVVVQVVPGETALAFYTVKNKTDKGIIGVATYNVHPPKAGMMRPERQLCASLSSW